MTSQEKPLKVLIATPCYGGLLHKGFFQSCLDLQVKCLQNGITPFFITIGNESLIQRGRNYYVSLVLSDPSITHLLFIDADISFNSDNIVRWLRIPDKHIICGSYPKKSVNFNSIREIIRDGEFDQTRDYLEQISYDYVVNMVDSEIKFNDGFFKVLYGGTGMMLINREVLDRMKEALPETKYMNDVSGYSNPGTEENFYALFDCIICPRTKRYLSEDYTFCNRAFKLGYHIWCDATMNLTHSGTHEFKGNYLSKLIHMSKKAEKAREREARDVGISNIPSNNPPNTPSNAITNEKLKFSNNI